MKTIIAIITLAALTGCATNLSPEERQRRAQNWENFLNSLAAAAAAQQAAQPRPQQTVCQQFGIQVVCTTR